MGHILIIKNYGNSKTFKIEISQFYHYGEPKQWTWNKVRYFFMGHIFLLTPFFIGCKIIIFIIGIFQFHCKSEHKQVKWNKMKEDMFKTDSIFPCLQSSSYLNDFRIYFLIRFISEMNYNISKGKIPFI